MVFFVVWEYKLRVEGEKFIISKLLSYLSAVLYNHNNVKRVHHVNCQGKNTVHYLVRVLMY